MTTTPLHERLRKRKQSIQVRAWRYRQRAHAAGTWDRLRRLLALSEQAFEVDDSDLRHLLERGHEPRAVGHELQPPKELVVLSREELASLPSARPLRVGLGADLLHATNIVLVPFDALGL